MTKSILKSITAGILIGAALFFMPMLVLALFILSFVMHMMFRMMMHHSGHAGFGAHHFAFADKVRAMSDEEYTQFKTNFSHGCCSHRQG